MCGRDLWEVTRYVSAGHLQVCDVCLDVARQALENADPEAGREVFMPPRVFGEVPDAKAVSEITTAFQLVHTDPHRYQEDAEELAPYIQTAEERTPIRRTGAYVDRIQFVAPEKAEVRFHLLLTAAGPFVFEGSAVQRDGRWLVSRDTSVRLLGFGGIQVPPKE